MKILDTHERGCELAANPVIEELVLEQFSGHRFAKFAVERMRLFHEKQEGLLPHSTAFPSLNVSRYTNPYRLLDRGSQYVVRNIANDDAEWMDKMFRLYLYRNFNLESTYTDFMERIVAAFLDSYPKDVTLAEAMVDEHAVQTLTDGLLDYHRQCEQLGITLYSSAYNRNTGTRFSDYIELIPSLVHDLQAFQYAQSLEAIFAAMKQYFGFGDFLAYQFALDVNYCKPVALPIDLVIPGPGAVRGIQCAIGPTEPDMRIAIIKVLTKHQNTIFKGFKKLYGSWEDPVMGHAYCRYLDLEENDVQNLFCEFSKLENIERFGAKVRRSYSNPKPPMDIQIPYGMIRYWFGCDTTLPTPDPAEYELF